MTRLNAVVHEDPLPEGDPGAFAPWLERRRRVLAELLGPDPQPVPLDLEVLESTACDGYRRDKVVFDAEDMGPGPASWGQTHFLPYPANLADRISLFASASSTTPRKTKCNNSFFSRRS